MNKDISLMFELNTSVNKLSVERALFDFDFLYLLFHSIPINGHTIFNLLN
jgi:hypothetical protein